MHHLESHSLISGFSIGCLPILGAAGGPSEKLPTMYCSSEGNA
ncbi:unnamed protein product, partial [Staurois parvus]